MLILECEAVWWNHLETKSARAAPRGIGRLIKLIFSCGYELKIRSAEIGSCGCIRTKGEIEVDIITQSLLQKGQCPLQISNFCRNQTSD